MTRCLPHLLPGLLLGLLPAFAACTTAPRTPFADTDYPGTLQPAGTLPADVVWQQRVTATWGLTRGNGGERGFDAAIQKQGDTLTVLGLSPMGSVGFALLLRGTAVEVRNDSGEDLPFPARFVLLDVQRTFYPWLGEPITEGNRLGRVAGEEIFEKWRRGRLVERTFRRLDDQPAGTITVRYEWGDTGAERTAPRRTVLHNAWFDYRLTVDTHGETLLPAAK